MAGNDPITAIFGTATAHVAARAIYALAELGVPDALDAPAGADDLADAVGAHPDALGRLLELAAVHGLFATDGKRWANNDASELLRSDHPASLRPFVRMIGAPQTWDALTNVLHTARTGGVGLEPLGAEDLWAYLRARPDQRALFDAAMTAKAHADVMFVAAGYDFGRFETVADVGGGRGHLLRHLLGVHAHLTGVLVDLPAVVAEVEPAPRLEVLAADLFVDPLPACDAYVLMQVLHDWDDDAAVAILRAVADAAAPGATVLVVEGLAGEPGSRWERWTATLDVLMLTVTGGRERTLAQYGELLARAGLTFRRSIDTAGPLSIVEAAVAGG